MSEINSNIFEDIVIPPEKKQQILNALIQAL